MGAADSFPSSDFDRWAETYDRDIAAQIQFPFDGYEQVLETVVEWAAPLAGMTVLDIGVGTGNLAARFADLGCEVWGSDFSLHMLEKARRKVTQAQLIHHDLRAAWPAELTRRFDRIVSAYTFHHFEHAQKARLALELVSEHLEPAGRLVIADLSFQSAAAMRAFARSIDELWEEEPYWIADEALPVLRQSGLSAEYRQVSPCAGVYRIEGR